MRIVIYLVLFFPLMLFAQSNPTCGNGAQDVGERCDDGNLIDGDGCSSSCVPEFCGDKVVNKKGEECDDGNPIDGDGCNECRLGNSPAASSQPSADSEELDPDKALRLAVVTTFFGPPGLGFIYGPSIGHFYAGESGRAVGMTLLRATLAGTVFLTTSAMGKQRIQLGVGGLLIVVESLTLQALVAADIIDAPRAARRANKK